MTDPAAEPTADRDPGAAAARATEAILRDTRGGRHRGVVVDSPPGAGKSTLVVRAARELAAAGEQLMIVAQTNAQVDDLADRLATADPELAVGRLHGSDSPPDPVLDRHPSVAKSSKVADLRERQVVIATAAKWGYVKDVEPWRHAIVDEAYQMRSDALLRVAGLFERALFVGDPGQLDPFSVVGTEQWAGLSYDPSASAVVTLLAHNPDLPQHRLPVSWRLPASAAPLISGAFYPYTPFRSGTDHGDRLLTFGVHSDGGAPDRVLDEAAAAGWGLLELPARHTPRTDPEAVAAVAAVVRRLLERGGVTVSERAAGRPAPVTADRIAVGTAHRDQAAAVRAALAAARGERRHGGHREPAPGAGVRRHGGAAPALRPPRRDRVPPGDRTAVRAGLPAPARVRRGLPGRGRRAAGRAPVDGAGAPRRDGEVPGRLGGQPRGTRPVVRAPGAVETVGNALPSLGRSAGITTG